MALSAQTIFEVRNNSGTSHIGSDNSGGGFVEGASGTDRSQQDAAFASGTNLTVDAATNTKVNPDGYTVAAADVGNIIQITTSGTGGTFTVGFYQITAATTGTSVTQRWTLDRSPAAVASLGATWAMGGALQTLEKVRASGITVTTNAIYATGTFSYSVAGANNGNLRMIGYSATRGDGGKATVLCTGIIASFMPNFGYSVENFVIDGGSFAHTGNFFATSGNGQVRNLEIKNVGGSAGVAFLGGTCRQIYLHDNTTTGNILAISGSDLMVQEFEAYNNLNTTTVVSSLNAPLILDHFILRNNGGIGVSTNNNSNQLTNGVIYACGSDGVKLAGSALVQPVGIIMDRVIITACTGKAINNNTVTVGRRIILAGTCYQYNNTGGAGAGFAGTLTTLSGDPFVNAAAGNFALNPSGADYASLKGVGFTYPSGNTIDYGDAGGAQHQEVLGGFIIGG